MPGPSSRELRFRAVIKTLGSAICFNPLLPAHILRSFNQLFLHVCVQLGKVSVVAGNSDDEPFVIIRVFNSVAHCVRGDDVSLPLHSAQIKIALHITSELVQNFFLRVARMRNKLNVKRNVVWHLEVIQPAYVVNIVQNLL